MIMSGNMPLVPIVKFSSIITADKLSSRLRYNNLETYSILWLDTSVNDAKEYIDAQQRLREIINYIRTFKTKDNCEQYIQSIPEHDRIFFIVNSQLGQELIPNIHQYRQIFAIYIYCSDNKRNIQWIKEFPKIKAVSTQIDVLVAQIKSDRTRRSHNKIDEPITISIFDDNANSQLNDHFIRSHLLIDCLLRIKKSSLNMEKFINLCKEEYKENQAELTAIHEFEKTYSSTRALRWYTKQSFLFRMLNKALRIENLEVLFLCHFLIYDIQQQLRKNQYPQPIRLYRAQLLTNDELQMLKCATGNFMIINTFLSTTVDRETSIAFLSNVDDSDEFNMHRVLFEIDADPRITDVKPFANIIWLSYCFGQQEILIMAGSIFQIVEIQHNNNQICIIRLVLSSENDHALKSSLEHLKTKYNNKELDLLSFGQVLYDMESIDDARKFYLHFLNDIPSDYQDLVTCYHVLGDFTNNQDDFKSSLEWYEKLHELLERTLKSDDSRLADSHTIIGSIYWKNNQLNQALELYNKALKIYKRAFDDNHLSIAACSEKIGTVHEKERKYFNALNYYEKALAIREKSLPPDHLILGMTHSKVANIRLLLNHHFLALGHFNIALKIKLNSLPPDHLDIASDYCGMGRMYRAKGEFNQALIYYEKAAEIYYRQLPAEHPDVIEIERTILFLSTQTT